MDCIRGAYSSIRRRIGLGRNHSSDQPPTRASVSETKGNNNGGEKHHRDTETRKGSDEKEVGRLRKFFNSLSSLQSRSTCEETHLDNETEDVVDANNQLEENPGSNKRNKAEYTRSDTVINVSEQHNSVEDHNEIAEIVPYSVAEKRLEEGDDEQMLTDQEDEELNEELDSEEDHDDGDTHIYPHPDPTYNIQSESLTGNANSLEIEVVISSPTGSLQKDKDIRQNDEDTLEERQGIGRLENQSITKASRSNNAQDRRVLGREDSDSREIYVSRNIHDTVETSQLEDFREKKKVEENCTGQNEVPVVQKMNSENDMQMENDKSATAKNNDCGNGLHKELQPTDKNLTDKEQGEKRNGESDETDNKLLEEGSNLVTSSQTMTNKDFAHSGIEPNDMVKSDKELDVSMSDKQDESVEAIESVGSEKNEHNNDSLGGDSVREKPDIASEKRFIKSDIQITILDEVLADRSEEISDGHDQDTKNDSGNDDGDSISVSSDTDSYRVI